MVSGAHTCGVCGRMVLPSTIGLADWRGLLEPEVRASFRTSGGTDVKNPGA